MSRWFRHYTGMMRDEKLVSAAVKSKQPVERVVWVWGAILESASEIDDAGRYELDPAEVAYFLRADEVDVASIIEALTAANRVADGVVVKWGDRQYQSDKSAERQARYRERKQGKDRDGDVRTVDGDAAVTSRDGVVTPQEADTDTEVRKEEPNGSSKKHGCRLPADFSPDMDFAQNAGLSRSQAQTESDKFRDYWNGVSGAKGVKRDWPGTWRNWVRSAAERTPKSRGSPGYQQQPKHDPFKALALELSDEQDRSYGSDSRNWDDAQGVPQLTIDYQRR